MHDSIIDGLNNLMDRVYSEHGSDICIVCESNSARKAIEPGLFFVLNRVGNDYVKSSCQEVVHLADRKIFMLPEKKDFDIDINLIRFENSRWGLQENASAILLAGGKSLRMGADKCFLDIDGKPLIEYILDQLRPNFKDTIVGTSSADKFKFLNFKLVEDKESDRGPLMGLLSCMEESAHEKNFVTACDVPDIFMHFVRKMLALSDIYDAIVPKHKDGMVEPLFAVYNKSTLPVLCATIADGASKVKAFLDKINVYYIELPEYIELVNLNTEAEYKEYVGLC
jgi:molybdopterin-guanine dinucleotide biosynthesis protein A